MPAQTKHDWNDLLTATRLARKAAGGKRPSVNAVSKAAGGGSTKRIEQAITAVEIENGFQLALLDTLPADLRALIKDPRDEMGTPAPGGAADSLPGDVRESLEQVAVTVALALRATAAVADSGTADAIARADADVRDMYQRLLERDEDIDVTLREQAERVADYERHQGEVNLSLGAAVAELANTNRELDGTKADLERAREAERDARAQWERVVEQQGTTSAATTANIISLTERALRAEATRDAAEHRLTGSVAELELIRSKCEAAALKTDAELQVLRLDLATAHQAHHDADRARAVSEALVAEMRSERDRVAAQSSARSGK